MKSRFCILFTSLIWLFTSTLMSAQTKTENIHQSERIEVKKLKPSKGQRDTTTYSKHKVSLLPQTFFSTYHPGIVVGYSRLLGKRFSNQINMGVLTSKDNEYARDTKGFRLGYEVKYFHKNTKNRRFYLAVSFEALKKNHKANLFYTMADHNHYTSRTRDDYFSRLVEVEKLFFSVTPRLGFQQYLGSKLVLDGYFGVGTKSRKVKHLNALDIERYHHSRDYESIDLEHFSNSMVNERIVNIDMNLRIAWTF